MTKFTKKELEYLDKHITMDKGGCGILDVKCCIWGAVGGDVGGNFGGDVEGDVYGNVKGDVYGNVKGDVKGDVWNNVEGDVYGTVKGTINGRQWKYIKEVKEINKDKSDKPLSASEAKVMAVDAENEIPELIVKSDILGSIRSQAKAGQHELHLGYGDDEYESLLIEWKLARDYLRGLGYHVIHECSPVENFGMSGISRENEAELKYQCRVTISWKKPWYEDK